MSAPGPLPRRLPRHQHARGHVAPGRGQRRGPAPGQRAGARGQGGRAQDGGREGGGGGQQGAARRQVQRGAEQQAAAAQLQREDLALLEPEEEQQRAAREAEARAEEEGGRHDDEPARDQAGGLQLRGPHAVAAAQLQGAAAAVVAVPAAAAHLPGAQPEVGAGRGGDQPVREMRANTAAARERRPSTQPQSSLCSPASWHRPGLACRAAAGLCLASATATGLTSLLLLHSRDSL